MISSWSKLLGLTNLYAFNFRSFVGIEQQIVSWKKWGLSEDNSSVESALAFSILIEKV